MVNSIDSFRKFLAPEVLFGNGTLEATGRFVRGFGVERALVVSDAGVAKASWTQQVIDSLNQVGIQATVFTDITSNPKDLEVAAGAAAYEANHCEMIVAVGGGSPMDAAKAIGVLLTNGGSVAQFEGVDAIDQPGPPLVCLPTTAGTSADISQFAIITDTGRSRKMAIVSKTMIPDIAIIDPRTGTTMDRALAGNTGIDALVHAIEAFVSTANSCLTDVHALRAIELIGRHLPVSCQHRGDLEPNEHMMMAALHAGLAFSNASLGAIHALGHAVGSLTDSAHGECVGTLMEAVIAYNYPAARGRYDQLTATLAQAMGVPQPASGNEALCDLIRELKQRMGFGVCDPPSGIRDQIPAMARQAVSDPCMLTNPSPMTLRDVEGIYERVFA